VNKLVLNQPLSVPRKLEPNWVVLVSLGLGAAIVIVVLVQQHSTIASLRLALLQQAPPPQPPASPPHPDLVADPAPADTNAAAVLIAPTNLPDLEDKTRAIRMADAQLDNLRKENEKLMARIRDLEEELTRIRTHSPEAQDNRVPYAGPGTWVTDKPSAGITRVVISERPVVNSNNRNMTIQAWGRCGGGDCEWGEVPFFFIRPPTSANSQDSSRRGFAAWETESWTKYVLVTFERAGLRVETISVSKDPLRQHFSTVERMVRLN
jgi:hypothetical protein